MQIIFILFVQVFIYLSLTFPVNGILFLGFTARNYILKTSTATFFFSRNTVHITLDNLFSREKIKPKLSAWLDTTKAVVPNPWSATPQVVIIKKKKKMKKQSSAIQNDVLKYCVVLPLHANLFK